MATSVENILNIKQLKAENLQTIGWISGRAVVS